MPYRKRLVTTATLIASGFATSALADDSVIRSFCDAKWNGEAMRSYCQEDQRRSAEAIALYSGPVRRRCEAEWRSDFHMVLFCIREQQALPQASLTDIGPD
ncbi:hypothetical protein [Metapseudomonas furukawaii]|jgi:hypothetical protein|uniref:Lipoprotein n=1 Tax=Metapseudomonas furukawaii TaxID=1149133 RepID=A0AAD1BZL2_METFU|nr:MULTISPECIES: hypothetical protein [Pseudomonas]ELS26044.1 hypothetical protein ppKF707_0017 [Pseudomonas furukawaii]OWJ94575.1 hypothetical protein B6S59_13730 [Pseudomonas sp. A46]WAG80508.1 hypothetical protein LMK08_07515 [Pseudomonas furukawaii]BAU73188.1 hypothetical protein KF707C_15000 [Pseudomonas furukawaii]